MSEPTAFTWSRLNHMQIGKYGEYYAKMEAVRLGFDVYTAEVDDKGIDFVLRRERATYVDVQVKAIRWPSTQYVFITKDKLELREGVLVCLVVFEEGISPCLYAVPSTVWLNPDGIFVSRDYEGKQSKAEYGIQLSAKGRSQLEQYRWTGVLQ